MADNLISCDSGEDQIYLHSGITATIADSFASPASNVKGLEFISPNLISCDGTADKIYLHSGISSTVTDSFAAPNAFPCGLASDGVNLISCDNTPVPKQIYVHSGVTSTITTSFDAPGNYPSGLTFDSANLISCDRGLNKTYIHSGVTSTITDSFTSPYTGSTGLAYDGTNLITCDYASPDKIYLHSGITATITDSFAAPDTAPSGLTYESAANRPPTPPSALLCEGEVEPTDVTDLTPEFSAVFEDPDTGDIANAVEIEVGTTPGASDLWSSGWIDISGESLVEGNRCDDQSYAGSALSLDGETYYWRIRFRDDDNEEGEWSANAQFTMGSEAPPVAVAAGGLLSQIW